MLLTPNEVIVHCVSKSRAIPAAYHADYRNDSGIFSISCPGCQLMYKNYSVSSCRRRSSASGSGIRLPMPYYLLRNGTAGIFEATSSEFAR